MVYKFRVILDAEDDVLRDIAIKDTDTLEDLHNTIINAFGFDGTEGGSFFLCDDNWEQQDEIMLFDMGDVPGEHKIMSDFKLNDLLYEDQTKILYIYDPFVNWTFFVELAAIEEHEPGQSYPQILFAISELPAEAPDKDFSDTAGNDFDFDEDDYDEDDLDMLDGGDNFEDYGFEENWN